MGGAGVGEKSHIDQGGSLMPGTTAHVKNEKQYEALKDKGMSKERAAEDADAGAPHESDSMPTPEQEEMAERGAHQAPDVSEEFREAAERGASAQGEGRI